MHYRIIVKIKCDVLHKTLMTKMLTIEIIVAAAVNPVRWTQTRYWQREYNRSKKQASPLNSQ